MADVINRTTVQYLRSVNTPDYPLSEWIHDPDISSLSGVPEIYWKISGDSVLEMTQPEKDAVDAAIAQAIKDSYIQQYQDTLLNAIVRGLADVVNARLNGGQQISYAEIQTAIEGYL